MLDDVMAEELDTIKKQLSDLQIESSVHKALILALMSELPTDKLTHFSAFRAVTQAELRKQPPQSDEEFYFRNYLNTCLERALRESSAQSNL